jgi:hypothetical protein
MGGVAIEDHMNQPVARRRHLGYTQEAIAPLMSWAFCIALDYRAAGGFECHEEDRGATLPGFLGYGPGLAFLLRKSRPHSDRGRDLAFFVVREDDSVGRRSHIVPHPFTNFLDELRLVGEFKLRGSMGRNTTRSPDSPKRVDADTYAFAIVTPVPCMAPAGEALDVSETTGSTRDFATCGHVGVSDPVA